MGVCMCACADMLVCLFPSLQCNNLGPLVSLRLGHDNAGLGRSVFVEMVLVHCITTGQTYR